MDAQLVLELSFTASDRVHIRMLATGALLCGEEPRYVEFFAELPIQSQHLAADLCSVCRQRVPA